jgi:hypothetical protein
VLSADQLGERQAQLAESADLRALRKTVARRVAPLLERLPEIPAQKALLSVNGGLCPDHGEGLEFDPWSPHAHRCVACGREHRGDRHDRAWARWQHLWLAERAADLATLAALDGDEAAAERSAEILERYAERYLDYPNRDNVLGPGRLFFSTYLESVWLTGYLTAAFLLREAGMLADGTAERVGALAEEAAALIGEFDEGFSNRQTWHNAALAAIAVWFEDEELAGRAIEGPTGIIAHLVRGFGGDGMWYEGENYHLFALRGQLLAMGWAAQAGVNVTADPRLAGRLAAALRAPALTALPDHTFPARKDSRFGVSLAQPMYLELWEIGLARLDGADDELRAWLHALYQATPPAAQRFDSYLHETGHPEPTTPRSRSDLSWWALLEMLPELPPPSTAWSPGSVLMEGQGLGILRAGRRYASLECGAYGGGHGHPDRLHLTLHADGIHWLPDPGAGSYVARDLFWYRSTLAHNAPRVDRVSQAPGDARCTAFEATAAWAWMQGEFGGLERTIVAGEEYLLDVTAFDAAEDHTVELPWHPAGVVETVTPGEWTTGELPDEFVSQVERFAPAAEGPIGLRADNGDRRLHLHLLMDGELLRGIAPGVPGTSAVPMFVARARGRAVRFVSVLETGDSRIRQVRASGELIEIDFGERVDRHVRTDEGWEIAGSGGKVTLGGRRRAPEVSVRPLIDTQRRIPPRAMAPHLPRSDALDAAEPLILDHEDQYRRSEDPYPGPEEFSAQARVGWAERSIHLHVAVATSTPVFRGPDAAPLLLDNDPDDVHSDGLQLYLRPDPAGPVYGFLVVPEPDAGTIRAQGAGGTAGRAGMVTGESQWTDEGYAVALVVTLPEWEPRSGDEVGFDLLVNRMEPDRERRAGQLAWSGGGGWVYLRGDRHDPNTLGVLELG